MAAPVAHTINGIPNGITLIAAMIKALEASIYAVGCSIVKGYR